MIILSSRPTRLMTTAAAFSVAVAAAAVLSAQAPPRAAKAYAVPRTGDGHPDLQGVWANNMATPLERPKEFANKPLLTDAELAQFKQVRRAVVRRERRHRVRGRRIPGGARAAGGGRIRRQLREKRDGRLQLVLAGAARIRAPHLPHLRSTRRATAAADTRGAEAPGGRRRGAETASGGRSRRSQSRRALPHLRRAEDRRLECRLQQLLPDRPEPRLRGDQFRDDPRNTHHSARRSAAPARQR